MAQKDLENIFDYIANVLNNPKAAFDLANEFQKSLENAQIFPQSYPSINNEYIKDKTLRKIFVNNYIVFYRFDFNALIVVRVLYGMSNYQEIL